MYQYRSTKCNVVKQNKVRLKNKKKPQTSTDFKSSTKKSAANVRIQQQIPTKEKKKGAAFLNSSTFVPKIVVRMRNGKLEDQMQKGVRESENKPKKMAEGQVGERC